MREQFCEIGIDDALIIRDFIFVLLIINMELYHTVQGYSVWYTAISRKVVGKSARDNPERHCGWF